MFLNKHWQKAIEVFGLDDIYIYNTEISDHPYLDQCILYLPNAFTVKSALFISPASQSGAYKYQETWFLTAYQYLWTTGSLVS